MGAFKANTFMYFGDKNVQRVSGAWKALHITFYLAIAVNAFISSMAAGNMFQTFKYNCILFCTDLVFETDTIQSNFAGEITENSTRPFDPFAGEERNVTDLVVKADVPPKSKSNETILFQNESHVYLNRGDGVELKLATIDIKKSRFASQKYCNFVLGVTLMTFITATFCLIMLAMCSKGGSGPVNNTLKKPQNMVYPILVSSIILGIINLTASLMLKRGIRQFCANFELFSGTTSCTSLINNFTIHERQGNFYLPYFVLIHTYDLTVVFYTCQVIVTLLRIVYAVDYQLYVMKENEEETELNGGTREASL